jgi:entericidin B
MRSMLIARGEPWLVDRAASKAAALAKSDGIDIALGLLQFTTRRLIMTMQILKTLVLVGLLGMTGALTACNTIQGAGKDLERGGEKIQDTARDTQKKM